MYWLLCILVRKRVLSVIADPLLHWCQEWDGSIVRHTVARSHSREFQKSLDSRFELVAKAKE